MLPVRQSFWGTYKKSAWLQTNNSSVEYFSPLSQIPYITDPYNQDEKVHPDTALLKATLTSLEHYHKDFGLQKYLGVANRYKKSISIIIREGCSHETYSWKNHSESAFPAHSSVFGDLAVTLIKACSLKSAPPDFLHAVAMGNAATVPEHSDDEAIFGLKFMSGTIIALSLQLGTRGLWINRVHDPHSPPVCFTLAPRSIYVMSGRAQTEFRHRVTAAHSTPFSCSMSSHAPDDLAGVRVVLTFRWISEHSHTCILHVPRSPASRISQLRPWSEGRTKAIVWSDAVDYFTAPK